MSLNSVRLQDPPLPKTLSDKWDNVTQKLSKFFNGFKGVVYFSTDFTPNLGASFRRGHRVSPQSSGSRLVEIGEGGGGFFDVMVAVKLSLSVLGHLLCPAQSLFL